MLETSVKKIIGPVIRLHPQDNVVIARVDVPIGTPIPSEDVVCRSQVAAGYKIAARAIRQGEPVTKYNVVIGFAAPTSLPAPWCTTTTSISASTTAITPSAPTTVPST